MASGPYRLVRHPGYLGSWLAFLPLAGALVVLVARTAFEDRFLRSHLPGYASYAQQVRHRLVPGLW